MAATPLSPENERELDALRARAYGPDADISLDPQAFERLSELEDMARPEAAPPASAEARKAVQETSAAPTASSPWWRRVPLSATLATTAVIGLGIGLAAPGLVSTHPHAVLSAAPRDGRGAPTFGSHGVIVGAPARYESFHDLDVWSAHMSDGAVCVLVISGDATWRESGCSPRPLDPMAEIETYPVIRAIEGLDLPIDSLVRFILRDGAIEVWIDESTAEKTAGT